MDLCSNLNSVPLYIGKELPHENAIVLEFVSLGFHFREFYLDVSLDL